MSKLIAYEENGSVVISSFSDGSAIISFDHIVLSELPTEPIECLYIEDGELKVNTLKLAEFSRKNMLNLTPIEFDIKLVDAGLYEQVQALTQSDIKLKIAYTRATFFSRLDPFITQASEALGLTPEQVDKIWTS